MEKIKKWMTYLAIVGTVLVTALFCLMPFKDMIKEYWNKTVSMEAEETLGPVQAEAEQLYENMTDVSENEDDEQLQPGEGKDGQSDGQTGNAQDGEAVSDMPGLGTDAAYTAYQDASGTEIHAVSFSVSGSEGEVKTSLWMSNDGICYVFLPGFAKDMPVQIEEIEGGGSIRLGSRELAESDVIEAITYEEAYEFTLLDKEGAELLRTPLIFMYSADQPVLMLSTESESMELIHASKEQEERGAVRLLGSDGALLYEGKAQSVKGRGNSTFGLLKKPYQIKLEEGADLFGFGEAKDFNLLADGYDETKLRNQIALGLAGALGMEYTPQGQSVDLYCNGVYYGVYYLCEEVQIGEGRIEIEDMEEYVRAAYTEEEMGQLETFSSEDGSRKWTGSLVEAEELSGGYLFERELMERYQGETSGFVTGQGDAYVLSSPKYATEEQVTYIADYMQEFQDALWEEDGVHPENGRHYSEYIDVDSFVKKYLLEEILRNYDGGVTSSFFYKKSDAEGGKLYAGPAWDYDVILGNCNLDRIASNPEGITCLNDHIYGTDLFVKLYEKEEFYEEVIALYEEKAVPYLTWLLKEGIDTLSEKNRQAVKLDDIRWQELNNRYQYYGSYENNIRFLKYYVEERKAFLDEVWLQGEVYHSITFMVDGLPYKEIYIKDGEVAGAASVPSRYNSIFLGWYSEAFDVPYDEFKPVYEDMVFYASWQELPVEEVVIVTGTETK